jgi:hypothetical protein
MEGHFPLDEFTEWRWMTIEGKPDAYPS